MQVATVKLVSHRQVNQRYIGNLEVLARSFDMSLWHHLLQQVYNLRLSGHKQRKAIYTDITIMTGW